MGDGPLDLLTLGQLRRRVGGGLVLDELAERLFALGNLAQGASFLLRSAYLQQLTDDRLWIDLDSRMDARWPRDRLGDGSLLVGPLRSCGLSLCVLSFAQTDDSQAQRRAPP